MPSYQLTGKSRHGDLYIGHRTDTVASALAKFIRWRYRGQNQRQIDAHTSAIFKDAKPNFTFQGWSLHLHTDSRPPTRR